ETDTATGRAGCPGRRRRRAVHTSTRTAPAAGRTGDARACSSRLHTEGAPSRRDLLVLFLDGPGELLLERRELWAHLADGHAAGDELGNPARPFQRGKVAFELDRSRAGGDDLSRKRRRDGDLAGHGRHAPSRLRAHLQAE